MHVIVDSLLIRYDIHGDGKKIVLLIHGWADSGGTFERLRLELQKQYTVVTFDLPGFGGSQMPPAPWGLHDYAVCVQHFLHKTGLTPYAIAGHSNGGAIALKGIAEGRIQAQKLVLIASAGVRHTSSQTARRIVWKVVAKIGKAATLLLPARLRKRLRARLYAAAGSDMLVDERLQETFKRVVAEDIQQVASRITSPVLLIYGDQDDATPPHYAELFARKLPHATLTTVEGAGHFVHQTHTGAVADAMQRFFV